MKKSFSLDEAFLEVLHNDYYWAKTGRSSEQRYYYRSQLKNPKKPPTLDLKLTVVEEAGFVVTQHIQLAPPVG